MQRELATAAEKLDKTIKTSSVQLDYVQESLDNNRAAIKEQAIEQDRLKNQLKKSYTDHRFLLKSAIKDCIVITKEAPPSDRLLLSD